MGEGRREKLGKSRTCIARFYFMFCLQMQLQCLHMRQQSAPSPQQLVGGSDPWRRKKSEKKQLWFSNTNRVLAEYRHGLWLYTSLSCDSGCCGQPLLKSSLEMRQQQSHKRFPPPRLPCNQPTSFASIPNVIPVNTLAASHTNCTLFRKFVWNSQILCFSTWAKFCDLNQNWNFKNFLFFEMKISKLIDYSWDQSFFFLSFLIFLMWKFVKSCQRFWAHYRPAGKPKKQIKGFHTMPLWKITTTQNPNPNPNSPPSLPRSHPICQCCLHHW
jgi:hypothetical protein